MNSPAPLTPPRFHAGQAVVCIDPVITHEVQASITCHLDMSTVYEVLAVKPRFGKWFLTLNVLSEFVFEEVHFAPAELLPDAQLAEMVAEALAGVPA